MSNLPAWKPFEIYLVWQERSIEVGSAQSALDALIEAGVPVEIGCRTGSCGECMTEFIEGDIIHKDSCLNDAERERHFCPCVSRAKTRIVLAL